MNDSTAYGINSAMRAMMAQITVGGALPLETTDRKRGDRPVYKLLDPITLLGITVPAGFLTDLVSAPKWARRWLPLSKMARASLIHDYACNRLPISKWACNALFWRQMGRDRVSLFWRLCCWAYVSRPFSPRVRWDQPYLHVSILDTLPGGGE
jgi:hypothetical protein